ncbi:DUF4822 domain-containing protein, partial [Leucobacter luti]
DEFTYRVIPDASVPDVYYDIIHTPTTHQEPGTVSPAAVLAATPWETTGAIDQDGAPVALDHPAVANFVGWAYYNPTGTFTMYNLDDTPKMQGDWEVAADGSTRTITARDADGAPLFTRVVPITVLTADEFTYRVIPDASVPDVYYDIIHTPTTHQEPGTGLPGEGGEDGENPGDGAGTPGTPGTETPGTETPGGGEGQGTETPGNAGGAGAGQTPDSPATESATTGQNGASPKNEALAVTGGSAPVAGGIAAALTALSGGALLALRKLRRSA